MKNLINDFFLMVQFMTRIPINKSFSCEQENFRRGTVFMPVIGLLVGGIEWIVYKLCMMVLPISVSVSIILLLGIMLTGALHLDGLGDMSDGFFAFKGNDKIIEIMKDSRIGSYACATIVMDIILKYSLLCSIVPRFSFIIIAAPVIGRFSIVFIAFIGRTAKKTGTGNFFIGNIGKLQMFLALVVTVAILFCICGMSPKYIVVMILAALIMALLINVFCNKKIGGLTGDLFGADNEMVEILTMIIAAVIITKLL